MADETTKAATGAESGSTSYLLVRAGEYLCALPLPSVRRVVRALSARPLPGSAETLKGLAEFAGEPLAVVDLARLVEAPAGANPDYPVTVVVEAGPADAGELLGLSADAALEVVELPARSVVAGEGGVILGEASVHGEPVRVLDLEALGRPP